MKEILDYVVVGAGISGLSAAFEFERNSLSGVVLETADKAGGCVESVCKDEFHQELGAHSVFNSYGGLLQIIESLSIEDKIIPKQKMSFLLWSQYKVGAIFKALNLPLLLVSVFKILSHKKDAETVSQFYGAIVGKKNYTRVIRHALNAVACQNMDQAPANFLFQKRARDKNFMRKFSFEQGLQTLMVALARSLQVKHNTCVTNISLVDGVYLLSTNQGEFYCKSLVLATPVAATTALIKDIAPNAYSALSKIKSTSFNSIAVVVDKDKLNLDKCAGWIGVDADFYSMVSADPVNTLSQYRGFTFHFKPDMGSKDELVEKIRQMLKVEYKDIKHISYKENALPIIGEHHYEQMGKIDATLKSENFGLSGNYLYGMSLEDCVQRSFSEVNRLINL